MVEAYAEEWRLDDEAATLSPSELAADLQEKLGQETAARVLGLADSRQIGRYRKKDGPRPRPLIDLRMREAYKIVGLLTAEFDTQVARAWLLGTNSRLGDKAPVELVARAAAPGDLAPVRKAAREFVLSQATVRDPLSNPVAVREALKRPMSERLELALSWNLMASELRAGILDQNGSSN